MNKIVNYLKWDQVRNLITEKKLIVFNRDDLTRLTGASKTALSRLLVRRVDEGKIVKIKRELYCLADNIPDDFLLANLIYSPSYISLETALSYYSVIPESVYSITSITIKPTREFSVLAKKFSYSTIAKKAFSGYIPLKTHNYTVLIATPEKALADFLYFVKLGKKRPNDRIDWKIVDKSMVEHHLNDRR